MWALDLLEGALGTWNSYMSEIWSVLTQSPQEFQGGAIWPVMEQIFSVLQGIGYGLLILFFAMSFFKQTASFRELRHPEQVFRLFIRFALAQGAITYGMDIISLIFEITGGITESIATSMGGLHEITASLPDSIREAAEDAGIIDQAFICLIGILFASIVLVISLLMLFQVYGRFFRVYLYVALAPLPLSAFGGELTSKHGRTFVQSFIGICLEAAIIVLACIIFTAFISGSDLPSVDFGEGSIGQIVSYMIGVIFQMLILLGIVKAADHVVKEMMGL